MARAAGGRHRWRPEALEALSTADWPGNVRQLHSFVARTCAGRAGGDIELADLPEELLPAPNGVLSQIERAELAAIVTGLRETGGNKVDAARHLGISRSTLYRKIRAYRIDAPA
jgi:transcriptional regulator of acetoin/glycerol metabolism